MISQQSGKSLKSIINNMVDSKIILQELKELLTAHFPDAVDKIILYGSRAHGGADEFSDYDILIVLNAIYDWRFEYEIQDVCWEIDFKYKILTDVKIISKSDLGHARGSQNYIINAFSEGIFI